MDQKTDTTQRALALEAGHEICRHFNMFQSAPQNEFAWVKHEGVVVAYGLRLRQLLRGGSDIHVRDATIAKDQQVSVKTDVDTGGLHGTIAERANHDVSPC